MKSSAQLKLVSSRSGPSDRSRAMPAARAALAPSGLSRCASQAEPPVAIASGFPIQRTVKALGDHEMVNPALRQWLAR